MLQGRNIHKTYGSRAILRGVDIDIPPGKITTLIGPSGSGKTTLLRALSLMDPPDKGEVILDGEKFSYPLAPGEIIAPPWPKLTVVFQQLFLWPHLTLRENIMLPLQGRQYDSNDLSLRELIDMFDMGEFIDRYPNEASVGQRQRAALARALVLNPEFVLLDEITSALDVEQIARILVCLKMLRERGIGVFLITHLINFARDTADQVVFLTDGNVLEAGGPEVITAPKHPRIREFLSVVEAAS